MPQAPFTRSLVTRHTFYSRHGSKMSLESPKHFPKIPKVEVSQSTHISQEDQRASLSCSALFIKQKCHSRRSVPTDHSNTGKVSQNLVQEERFDIEHTFLKFPCRRNIFMLKQTSVMLKMFVKTMKFLC